MSFDSWIHLLEIVLVGGMFSVSLWVLKSSSRRSASLDKDKKEETRS